jgi:hypothetical protein
MGVVTGGTGWFGGGGGVATLPFLQPWIDPKTKKPTLKMQKKIKCFIARGLGVKNIYSLKLLQ